MRMQPRLRVRYRKRSDVKVEDDEKEKGVARSVRGGSVRKGIASILSSISDKSTKRQRK